MPEVVDIEFIRTDDAGDFEEYLQTAVRKGFQPHGTPTIFIGEVGSNYRYNQVMVKYARKD